uniref:Uncharacterized protein n=1 Tax=Glossina austeni TaxID=7395 RepID=A0A1A9V567_GLOAU
MLMHPSLMHFSKEEVFAGSTKANTSNSKLDILIKGKNPQNTNILWIIILNFAYRDNCNGGKRRKRRVIVRVTKDSDNLIKPDDGYFFSRIISASNIYVQALDDMCPWDGQNNKTPANNASECFCEAGKVVCRSALCALKWQQFNAFEASPAILLAFNAISCFQAIYEVKDLSGKILSDTKRSQMK